LIVEEGGHSAAPSPPFKARDESAAQAERQAPELYRGAEGVIWKGQW